VLKNAIARLGAILVLCTAGLTLVGNAPASAAGAKAPLVIGTIDSVCPACPSAGTQAPNEVERAITVWAKWTNAHGGIAGHKVQVIYKNDNGDAAQAIAAITSLDQNNHVLAIVGQNDSGTITAWASYAQQHQLPVIGGENYNISSLTNPMFFMNATSVLDLLYGQIAKAKLIGKTKYGALYCSAVAACAQANPVLRADAPKAGVQYVFDQAVSNQQPNYTANCLAAQSAGVEMLQLNGVPVPQIVRNCAQQGTKFAYGLVNPDPAYLSLPGINGSIGNLPSFPAFISNAATATFHAAFKKYDKSLTPTISSSQTWTAGLLFAKAAANVGAVPTRQQLLDALYKIQSYTFGGLTPPVSYGPAGSPNPQIHCYFIFTVKNGRYAAPSGLKTSCAPGS
jgi:branched-chain amino acid transport system substrate-binding protein